MQSLSNKRVRSGFAGIIFALALTGLPLQQASAASRAAIDKEVSAALKQLYAKNPAAKDLGAKAKAILVFPSVWKAGFIVGAQGGNGALRKGGKTVGYYNVAAASYGLQAGAQQFGYAMFLMSDGALESLSSASGLEIGVGPTVVVVDQGVAQTFSTMSARSDIYAFVFSQRGLMAGLGLQGNRIAKVPRR